MHLYLLNFIGLLYKKDNYKDARNSSTSRDALICGTCSRIYCCNGYLDCTLNYRKYFFGSIHNIVGQILQEPLSVLGASLWGAIIAVILVHVLWSCGIHGATIVGGVMSPVWLSLMDQNRVAFKRGKMYQIRLPHSFLIYGFIWAVPAQH